LVWPDYRLALARDTRHDLDVLSATQAPTLLNDGRTSALSPKLTVGVGQIPWTYIIQ
jgi:hypothetical protein